MNHHEAHKRLLAAHTLLMEPTTTREKFNSIRTLIEGVNPSLDAALARVEQELSTWDQIQDGDVIHLTAKHLPENTEEEKKRKKWLLLFINSWRQLKSEVARVEQELQSADNAQTTGEKASHWGKIFSAAKGPLGIITVLAIGVAVMQQTSVEITIQNKGCATMYPSGSIPFSLPGLSLPKDPIPSGGSAVAELPGLTVNVDGTSSSALVLSVLTFSMTFQLSDVDDVTLDGVSLLGKKTEVRLSESDEHTLILTCS
ncbi:hypothetical protein A3A38_03275 [Candidatus Kaiserbacteria bacterium RIFCSPLOWO2_01_FULL_53_17]|uniref:Uncharacterized protein n=1 Tax=Candidatus Kaiserbacteria bacterium RIFCSPLOWO2_01_FULL_53_17 TaxID=1798511 RepID=A0A1F6EH18_9BACT|nr:MAG: hypothetical protein A3A38_03275 [Candidatus Kaiserbacteria bacterium RIFCSPLOWO2_01_FULL_53_17]